MIKTLIKIELFKERNIITIIIVGLLSHTIYAGARNYVKLDKNSRYDFERRNLS
jgi:hypothetical protein